MPETKTKALDNNIDKLDPKQYIIIKKARVNNLKNVSLAIPRYKFTVITGVSGSGKSSLAFDTLFAEGQRMYVESLSSYARQFLGRMEKPEVDYIRGVSPAIAIEQKVITKNPRSTVGTTTEVYDYLKLLFARIGKTISPDTGEEVKKDSVADVTNFVNSFEDGQKIMVLSPLKIKEGRKLVDELKILLQKGFSRIGIKEEVQYIEDVLATTTLPKASDVQILIDRTTVKKNDEENQYRLADSIQTAFFEGEGECTIDIVGKEQRSFSDRFEAGGRVFEEPSVNFFNFNNPYGACSTCEGFGWTLGIDKDLVIPNKSISVFEGAIVPWKGEKIRKRWLEPLLKNGIRFDFPIHRPYEDLDEAHKDLLWTGNEYFRGLNDFFKFLESKLHKIQYRVMLSRYRGRTICPDCRGTRLRKDASYVKIDGKSITDIVLMPVKEAVAFFDKLKLSAYDQKVAERILKEIQLRLSFLDKVGLGYLTLNRLSNTLSGGESQRIKLATSLGSALVGSMYILDEPSIGLHPRDTEKLIEVLKELRNIGNSVIVVEHDEEIIRAADEIIDIGPGAGSLGGDLTFQGDMKALENAQQSSLTAKYLFNHQHIPVPEKRRTWKYAIEIQGGTENNLKNIDVKFPLNTLTVITGVSGSGKSTLVKKLLFPALQKEMGIFNDNAGKYLRIDGDYERIHAVEFVDQNPIGKSSRSNPVTYVKAYDSIRQLFADLPLSQQRGYKPAHFSFNVDGGRCDVCQGEGTVKIEMQFMADIHLTCENCKGKRFKQDILDIKYNDKNIYEVLEMTVDDSMDFFKEQPKITDRLGPLQQTGLGYVTLGQSSDTLSGGEAQRVKLAFFLSKGGTAKEPTLFIFDEPSTGLHFHDIQKLLAAINALIDQGHSAIIIEHNLDIIKSADWVIDLGPEGGHEGGSIVFEGTPEEMIKTSKGYTAGFLKEKLK